MFLTIFPSHNEAMKTTRMHVTIQIQEFQSKEERQ